MKIVLLPLLIVLTTQAAAQARPKTAGASLAGDVYLVMQNGDIKRGAAVEVVLFHYSDQDSIFRQLDLICASYRKEVRVLLDSAKVLEDSLREHPGAGGYWTPPRNAVLLGVDSLRRGVRTVSDAFILGEAPVAARTRTGLGAHYAFADLRPGAYRVRAMMMVGDHEYRWWLPVVLRAGENQTLDLNHLNVSEFGSCPE